MPWKFVDDFRFYEVLQTTIIRQITKENEEIEKIEKYSQIFMCAYVYVCVCVWGVIVAYYCEWRYKWCLVYVHTQ